MDDLGIDDKIIENLNIITKILAARGCNSKCDKRFISSRGISRECLGGDE